MAGWFATASTTVMARLVDWHNVSNQPVASVDSQLKNGSQRDSGALLCDRAIAMNSVEAWELVRQELLRKIETELADKPADQKSVFFLESSDGDMTEFPTMLGVVDELIGAEPLDWRRIIKEIESR